MTNLEFLIERRKAELPAFVRVLKAIPAGGPEYRPDPKSRSAVELAWLLACEEAGLLALIEQGSMEWKDSPAPGLETIVGAYEGAVAKVDERLATLDDVAWQRKVAMTAGGTPVWEDTLGNMVWGFLFDAIHHRGQLSTYLRPMGGKVPAIYGPSADDKGQ